jgi:hypothetical protein
MTKGRFARLWKRPRRDVAQRLRVFDQGTARQRERDDQISVVARDHRGWSREELYDRPRLR